MTERKRVLVVDDDRDIDEIVQTILIDEGFRVSCLYVATSDEVKATVEHLDPHCVLLDGGSPAAYGLSWDMAAWLATRPRPIPTVMLTGHSGDRDEAVLDETTRARAAQIAGVIPKPFDIDRMVAAVHSAVGDTPPPTDRQEEADAQCLLAALRAAGAEELRSSRSGRVWATFRGGEEGALYKVYRWRSAGVYFVGAYAANGTQLRPLGQFATLEALVAFCGRELRRGRT